MYVLCMQGTGTGSVPEARGHLGARRRAQGTSWISPPALTSMCIRRAPMRLGSAGVHHAMNIGVATSLAPALVMSVAPRVNKGCSKCFCPYLGARRRPHAPSAFTRPYNLSTGYAGLVILELSCGSRPMLGVPRSILSVSSRGEPCGGLRPQDPQQHGMHLERGADMR
ncbi:hypothetical protein OH77DRAFT_682824 [Trametes cingulata]|nr:hypothetical protein OH77DRAFT_682824 [Trametes cingulata]